MQLRMLAKNNSERRGGRGNGAWVWRRDASAYLNL